MDTAFQVLLDRSQQEKRGLTFFVNGQTLAGIVTQVLDEHTVEVRNQTYDRVIIRLDRVDAVAMH